MRAPQVKRKGVAEKNSTQRGKLWTLMNKLEVGENANLQRNSAVKQKLLEILERYRKVFSSP